MAKQAVKFIIGDRVRYIGDISKELKVVKEIPPVKGNWVTLDLVNDRPELFELVRKRLKIKV